MILDLTREDINGYFQPLEQHPSWHRLMSDDKFSQNLDNTVKEVQASRNSLENPEQEKDRLMKAHIRKMLGDVKAADPDLDWNEEWPEEEWEDGPPQRVQPFLKEIAEEVADHTTIAEKYASRPEEMSITGFTVDYRHDDQNHMLRVNMPAETVESIPQGPIEAWLNRNENIPTFDVEPGTEQFYREIIRNKRNEYARAAEFGNEYIQRTTGTDIAKAVAPFHADMEEWNEVPDLMDNIARKDEDRILEKEPVTTESGMPWAESDRDAPRWMKEKRLNHINQHIDEYRGKAEQLGEELLEAFDYNLTPEEYAEQTINQAVKLAPEIEDTFSEIEGSYHVNDNAIPALMKLEAADVLRETVAEGMEDEYTESYIRQSMKTDMSSEGWYAEDVEVGSPNEDEVEEMMEEHDVMAEAREVREELDTYIFDRKWIEYNSQGRLFMTSDNEGLDIAKEAGIGSYDPATT